MAIYLIIYLIIFLLVLLEQYAPQKRKMHFTIMTIIVIGLFQGLRWRTGTDWPYYLKAYELSEYSYSYNILNGTVTEYGHYIINRVFNILGFNYSFFLLFECLWILINYAIFAKIFKVNNISFVLLYYFCVQVFPVRATLAASLIILSYKFILERKFYKFLFLVVSAALIHSSAIIFLPFYFLSTFKISSKYLILLYIICSIIGFYSNQMLGGLTKLIPFVTSYSSESMAGKFEYYTDLGMYESHEMTIIEYVFAILNTGLFILIFAYFRKRCFKNNQIYGTLFNLYVIGMCLNRLFLLSVPEFVRITPFFTGGYIIMLCWIIAKQKRNILILIFLSLYFVHWYYSKLNGYFSDLYLPYYSVIESTTRNIVY